MSLQSIDREEALEKMMKWRLMAFAADHKASAFSIRCCALEDKLRKLLQTIESDGVVTKQFIKESYSLLDANKK